MQESLDSKTRVSSHESDVNLAPVVTFAYNRPEHLQRTLSQLSENTLAAQSKLFVICDGAKEGATREHRAKVEAAQLVAKDTTWPGELNVVVSPQNKGLAKNVLTGVSSVLEEHESVIVLEDDLLVGKYFLEFMNESLRRYESHESVMQISGFTFPIGMPKRNESFFMPVTNTIGWGTWRRVWQKLDANASGCDTVLDSAAENHRFNLEGTYDYAAILKRQIAQESSNDSWGILFWWHVFSNRGLVLYPNYSLIQHKDDNSLGVHKSGLQPLRHARLGS